jgi:hypothetical protein
VAGGLKEFHFFFLEISENDIEDFVNGYVVFVIEMVVSSCFSVYMNLSIVLR